LDIRTVGNGFAAELTGLEVSRLDDADLARVRKAYTDSGVIFLRDQELSPEQHIELAERFGQINVNRFFQAVEDYPQIAEVRKEPDQQINIGGGWHTDHSYDQIPAMGSILYAREVPDTGGDTLFANMYSVYESLSDGLKQTLEGLEGLEGLHSSRHVFGSAARSDYMEGRLGNPEAATQDAVHPVVIRHPLSGRKALYVNPAFTIGFKGWTAEESAPLLEFLYRHAVKPEHTYRFHWRKGSVAFWDNRATWHYAINDYHGQRRLMHRITIEGEPLV